jgi:hypothetical protein
MMKRVFQISRKIIDVCCDVKKRPVFAADKNEREITESFESNLILFRKKPTESKLESFEDFKHDFDKMSWTEKG